MKRIILGEAHDILKIMPVDQLVMFDNIRQNDGMWEAFKSFVQTQKQIKLDTIYRLRRPKTLDDTVKNAVEHDYHCGKIASYVVLLQIMENARAE
jgi:hypothetical protein